MAKHKFIDGMMELSGFGGDYEKTCRRLVCKGADWMEEHPNARINFSEYKQVFGIAIADGRDSEKLLQYITENESDLTGAMIHQACIHLSYIKVHGWDSYVKKMIEMENKKAG